MCNEKHPQTRLIHPETAPPEGFESLASPVTRASTVVFPDTAAFYRRNPVSGYTYGLSGTPTSRSLADKLALIEGARHCLLAPSGLAAITLVYQTLLQSGDEVLIPDNAYGPSQEFAHECLPRWGVRAVRYNPEDTAGLAGLVSPRSRLIWVESPGSITMEVADVPEIVRIARTRGLIVALDNTWSAGLAFAPFGHGVDLSVQALTKFQSGGSDVLMGSITTCSDELYDALQLMRQRLGLGVSVDDCYLVLRSLPSLRLRFAAQDAAARQVAAWLARRAEVQHVLHPALPGSPGHALWARDFSGAGSLFSIVFQPTVSAAGADRFVDRLQLFKIGFSWGGSTSLALPYDRTALRLPAGPAWKGPLVRLFIGLEEPADLIRDLAQALDGLTP